MRLLHRTDPIPRCPPSLEKPSWARCVAADGSRAVVCKVGDRELWNAAVVLVRRAVVACAQHLAWWALEPAPEECSARKAFLERQEEESRLRWRDFASWELLEMLRDLERRGVSFEMPSPDAEVALANRIVAERRENV